MKAYKLFRVLKSRPGELFPLFIDRTTPVPIGEWIEAECHPTPGFAVRPGWHASREPSAPHLSMEGRVWAEVAVSGWYEWQRPANQGGSWIIAERMKVLRILQEK
jgi:hypothetical protein